MKKIAKYMESPVRNGRQAFFREWPTQLGAVDVRLRQYKVIYVQSEGSALVRNLKPWSSEKLQQTQSIKEFYSLQNRENEPQ